MPIVRARDVRANIKEYGFENGIVLTVETMLDEFAEYRQHMREIVELQQQMIDNLEKLHRVGSAMQNHLDRMKRDRIQGDDIANEGNIG